MFFPYLSFICRINIRRSIPTRLPNPDKIEIFLQLLFFYAPASRPPGRSTATINKIQNNLHLSTVSLHGHIQIRSKTHLGSILPCFQSSSTHRLVVGRYILQSPLHAPAVPFLEILLVYSQHSSSDTSGWKFFDRWWAASFSLSSPLHLPQSHGAFVCITVNINDFIKPAHILLTFSWLGRQCGAGWLEITGSFFWNSGKGIRNQTAVADAVCEVE